MGQANKDCEKCGRVPGAPHLDECPRSRLSQARLASTCHLRGTPRPVWLFGPQVVNVPGKGRKIGYNPGVPYVNPKNGKPWTAGGRPRDMDKKVEEFKQSLEAQQRAVRVPAPEEGKEKSDGE